MPSSSLIPPPDDPTLLLTSAGMVQFKPYFMGERRPPKPRLTSVQKCFRVTDVDEVGDASHLTFFEMLGNFSVGDYFKEKAIEWAWEFVTERMKLPKERLWATIYLDDDEARDIWLKIDVPDERIRRFGKEENFWGPAGNEGPCGPCSEIHYDFGGTCRQGKPDEECGPNCECGRFLELWNLVFMQFYQDTDGQRTPLPNPNIDTGMGLERAALILQDVPSIYETDLFQPLVARVCQLSDKEYGKDSETDVAIRVVAEHARSAAFLIADSVAPDNQGRGYVLRRLIRRAIRFARKLGLETGKSAISGGLPAHPELVEGPERSRMEGNERGSEGTEAVQGAVLPLVAEAVIQKMGPIYPNLAEGRDFVLRVLQEEEERFSQVYETGMRILEEMFESERDGLLAGEQAFLLYDTYGFPVEVTAEIAREHGMEVDMEAFQSEMEAQRESWPRRRGALRRWIRRAAAVPGDECIGEVNFLGYETTTAPSVITGLIVDGQPRQ